ncbi:MAG: HlyC/CorC family transporter [Pseudomonadota bacterium]
MTLAIWLMIAAILVLICTSGFFSGSETALTAASRGKMHALAKSGDARARIVQNLIERKDRLIATLLLANNLVNILASALATSLFLTLFGDAGVVYATIVMTIIVVVFAEVLPKSWALADPDGFARRVSPLVAPLVVILRPFVGAINFICRRLLRMLGFDPDQTDAMMGGRDELRGAVEVMHMDGAVVKDERDRLGGLLDLRELEVSDVMVHRTSMMSLDADLPNDELVAQILDAPFTRIPLWRGSTENIVGIIHAKDLLRALARSGNQPADLDLMDIAAEPWFVPDSTTLEDQLNAFLRRKAHQAIVVDEYGETEGLVTLEDIIEEIVGDISDEHDLEMSGVKQDADGSVLVEGSVPIRDLNRAMDWSLPDDEATTVAGLLIHEAQMIPEEKQVFTFHGKRFSVLRRERNRITKLRLRALD